MVNITINGRKTSVQEGTTILNAAQNVGVEIPHLCYWEDLNEIGACRICVVELEGKDKLVSSCNTEVEEGMVIHTSMTVSVRPAREAAIACYRRSPETSVSLPPSMRTIVTIIAGTNPSR